MVINLSIPLTHSKSVSRISLQAAQVNTHFQFQCARNKRQFSFTTELIEMRRAQQRVPWRWIFEIVMMAADELHTLCSYRWISRILVQSNSWRLVWIFLSPTGSVPQERNNGLPLSPTDFSAPALSAMRAKSQTSNACKILNFNRENLKF